MRFYVGAIVGAVIFFAATCLPQVAPFYSQYIYDCGIRVAAGADMGTISGFSIRGHSIAVCVDGGVGDLKIEENNFHGQATIDYNGQRSSLKDIQEGKPPAPPREAAR